VTSASVDRSWVQSIDFGTTFTTAAMLPSGGSPQVLEIENSRYLPSVVVRDETGQLVTGRAGARQAVVFPERAERVPKRALVAGSQVVLGGQPVPVADLVAALLGRVYVEATRFQGGTAPGLVVLTHPARWGQEPLGRLREAAARAGIANPVLVAEPVAAAWWYGKPAPGQVVAVFDLGGGTLDTAVLRAEGGGFVVAGQPGGNADLGGEDFDEFLLSRVSELARERDEEIWREVFAGSGARARSDRAHLRSDVTTAKEALSEYLTYELPVAGFADTFRLTRSDLEQLIGPAVDQTVAEMRRTITAAGLSADQLTSVFLTGGSSRIPLIAQRLADSLGTLPQLRDDPKAAVALGALTAATAGTLARRGTGHPAGGDGDQAPRPKRTRAAGFLKAVREVGKAVADGLNAAAEDLSNSGEGALLAGMLMIEDDPVGARDCFRHAAENAPSESVRAEANLYLGAVLAQLGDMAGARAALRKASDAADPEVAAQARRGLGQLLTGTFRLDHPSK